MIKNLTPSLPEVGKIKIGFKGKEITSKQGKKFQPPNKLDYFIVTGLERGPDGNFIKNAEIHKAIGEQPKEIDVRLLYDDPNLNFLTRYVCYSGTKIWCTGDGEKASRMTENNGQRADVKCPCEHLEAGYKAGPKCKLSGVLSVMLDAAPIVGGVYKFRTTGWNSVNNILSSMILASRITGGILGGIPLKMTFSKKTTTIPETGQQTTVPVVSLLYKGTVPQLAEIGQRTALEFAGYRKRIEYIEDIARKQLDKEMGLGIYTEAETDEDIVAEFYPEQVGATGSAGEPETLVETKSFEDLINESISDSNLLPLVDKFITMSAKALSITPDEVKIMAVENFPDFLAQFIAWSEKNTDPPKGGKSAAPEKPSAEKTVSNEETASAETSKAATSGQGPQPPTSGDWNPMNSDPMKRYSGDKARILIESCKAHGIEYVGKSALEMHQELLKVKNAKGKELTERENGQRDNQDTVEKPKITGPLFPKMEESEKMEALERIHGRIKTIAGTLITQTANETGMNWDEVKGDVGMAEEFILYCFACYKNGNVMSMVPEELRKEIN